MSTRSAYLAAFTRGYVECLLWSETDGDGDPLDGVYTADDIDIDSMTSIQSDCRGFVRDNWPILKDYEPVRAGHYFLLTRNRHGAGFWDGEYPDDIGRKLTDAAHAWGETCAYVDDRDVVWVG